MFFLQLNALDDSVLELGRKIQWLTNISEKKKTKVLEETDTSIYTQKMSFESRKNHLQTEVLDLKNSAMKRIRNNFLQESTLRKRKFKIYNELLNWIAKYDQDMTFRQVRYKMFILWNNN